MLAYLGTESSLINLSSSVHHEYAVQYFIEDLRYVLSEHAPFAEEFLPYLEGGIDIIGFFSAKVSEEFHAKYLKLKDDFTNFRTDPTLLKTLVSDCKKLFSFPRLRFADRISAFEEATAHLETCAGADLSTLGYNERVYIYSASKALNEIHEELCNNICAIYDNCDWEDYFDFQDLQTQAHDFLFNPTLHSQLQLQVILSLLKAKIHNL